MQGLPTPKPCAVVVPESVKKCRDVLPASSQLVCDTPYPFGICICTWDVSNPGLNVYLPMVYVSEQVAKDRASKKHECGGVHPGWYVIAQPGLFEVHVSYLKPEYEELPWEDGWGLTLEVDGQSTNVTKLLRRGCPTVMDSVREGFAERQMLRDILSNEGVENIRLFEFEKINKGTERRCEDTNVGTICLKVAAGICQDANRSVPRNETRDFEQKRTPVSEKAMAKEGRTMRVSDNGSLFIKPVRYTNVCLTDRRRVPQADICVNVREKEWLRSRRLIDDDGRLVTYKMYQKMLQEDLKEDVKEEVSIVKIDKKKVKKNRKMTIKDKIDLDGDETPVKKARTKEEPAVEGVKQEPADVWDLT